jgi:hypothetical protein
MATVRGERHEEWPDAGLWQTRRMTWTTCRVTGMLVLICATATVPPRALAAEPARVAKGAQAEVQIGLCSPADRIVRALDLRPGGAPITVWQFDDAELTLFGRGLRLRLRVGGEGRSVLTLKAADQDCARLDPGLVPAAEGKCEYDAYGTRLAGAVSLDRALSAEDTRDLIAGRLAPAQVLSPSQVRFLREVAGIWPLPSGLRGLGPMQVRTYRTTGKRYDVDISRLPGGEHYAEISRKVPVAHAGRTRAAMEAELSRAGVEKCADQSSQAIAKLRSLLR